MWVVGGGGRCELVFVFVLVVNGSKSIIRELSLVICFFLFCFDLPDTFLFEWELTPAVALRCVYQKGVGRGEGRKSAQNKPIILDKDP